MEPFDCQWSGLHSLDRTNLILQPNDSATLSLARGQKIMDVK